MRRRLLHTSALLCALLLVATACGGDDDADDAASDGTSATADGDGGDGGDGDGGDGNGGGDEIDACALLPQEEAEKILGRTVREPEEAGTFGGQIGECIWELDSEELTEFALLQLYIWDGEQYYGESIYENAEPLDIGEKGFVAEAENGLGAAIQFIVSGKTVSLDLSVGTGVPGYDAAAGRAELERVAADIAAALS